jgi:hypothetical protein
MARLRLESIPRAGLAMAPASIGGLDGSGSPGLTAGAADGLATGPATSGEAGGPRDVPAHPGLLPAVADDAASLAEWDARVSRMLKSGDLRVRERTPDGAVKGRTHQRLAQFYKGVPVFGADITRTLDGQRTVAIIGAVYQGIDLDPEPAVTVDDAIGVFEQLSPAATAPSRAPELMVLPTDDGRYLLTYRARVPVAGDVKMAFVDANTGEIVLVFSDLRRPAR